MRKVRSKPAKTISAVSQGLARYLFCLWCIVQGHSRGIKAIQVCRQWDGGEGLFSDLLHYLSTHSGIIPCLHCVRITGWMEWRRISPNVWWDLPVEWHGVTSVNVLFAIGKCLKYSSPLFHLGWVKNHKTNICKAWEPQFISSDNMHLFSFLFFAGLKSTQGKGDDSTGRDFTLVWLFWAIMHLEVEKPQFLQWAFMVSRSSSTRLESERKKIYTHCLFPISSEIRRWGKIVFLSFQFNVAAGLPRSFAAPVNFAIMSFSKGETDLMTKPEGPRVKEVRVIWGRGEATAQDRLLVLYFEHEGSGGVLLTDTYLISFQSRISLCGDIDE